MIQLRQVTKRFRSRLAVDNLTLAVPRGEIYGLLGHNGAGKSTAIGMMLGQVWPTCGEVRVCGFDVAGDRRRALRKVGAIFETPAFHDYLSGWRNLHILAHYTARTASERAAGVNRHRSTPNGRWRTRGMPWRWSLSRCHLLVTMVASIPPSSARSAAHPGCASPRGD